MFIKKKFFLVLVHSYETIKMEASCSYECDQNENLCFIWPPLCANKREKERPSVCILLGKNRTLLLFFFGFDKSVIIWCPCRKFRWMITFERVFLIHTCWHQWSVLISELIPGSSWKLYLSPWPVSLSWLGGGNVRVERGIGDREMDSTPASKGRMK